MAEYTIYDVQVSLLTPLHIGNGRELMNEYDYAIRNGKTWRIDERTLLDDIPLNDSRLKAARPPAEFLRSEDFKPDSPYFRYVLSGTPRSQAEGAVLREQIKNPFDRPYLPGSSVKGALRTAVAWYAWEALDTQPEIRKVGRNPKFAAQEYEHDLFGPNPNHDLLRALHVSDSAEGSAGDLIIVNARVLNRGGGTGSPIELEALRPDAKFSLTIKLDRALFSRWAQAAGLQLNGARALATLPQVVQQHSMQRIQREAEWFSQIRGAQRLAQFYAQLAQAKLGRSMFLVQLGWGAGWESKTLGSRLQADKSFMERLVRDYSLARGRRQEGDPFPKSRRMVVAYNRASDGRVAETPGSPLGWALVEMKERR
jgi:CRISPR-associated protein Csm5